MILFLEASLSGYHLVDFFHMVYSFFLPYVQAFSWVIVLDLFQGTCHLKLFFLYIIN